MTSDTLSIAQTNHHQTGIGSVSVDFHLLLCVLLWGFLAVSCFPVACKASETQVKRYTVDILRTIPHSTSSFTQGFLYHNGFLYESTGLVGHSSLQKITPDTGEVLERLQVDGVFAEGLSRWDNRLIQLTWKDRFAYIYNLSDFSPAGIFQYQTEGWGLTSDEQHLIMSDGTDVLYFRNPRTFAIERRVKVTFEGRSLPYLNELEYVDGSIYANVWYQDVIVQIDPASGKVLGIIGTQPILRMLPPLSQDSVLNGIAYNTEMQTFYLTGKNWPKIFEVTLIQEF
ncbi:glutamine cyclotransferase [candidate division KSB3 bacterium]|uniref:Glutamine cyclotransferase n=1 Tax=candidate division KSB3 bacterium TaxID=2044937 RepID=A0A2G6KI73_9BACT|nr:MAG: glutamine cyclotransferase [candidate division KSB3 bacterium]